MRTRTVFTNLIIASMFLLTAIGFPGGTAAYASSGDAAEPAAVDAMPAPTIVFPGLGRLDNNLLDTDIFPTDPDLLNDPRLIGAVPDTTGAAGHTH